MYVFIRVFRDPRSLGYYLYKKADSLSRYEYNEVLVTSDLLSH